MNPLIVSAATIKADLRAERARRARETRRKTERDQVAYQRDQPLDPVVEMLIATRQQCGWSQQRVAHEVRARFPYHQNFSDRSIHQYEHGLRSPSLARLRLWAAVLDVEIHAEVNDEATPE